MYICIEPNNRIISSASGGLQTCCRPNPYVDWDVIRSNLQIIPQPDKTLTLIPFRLSKIFETFDFRSDLNFSNTQNLRSESEDLNFEFQYSLRFTSNCKYFGYHEYIQHPS